MINAKADLALHGYAVVPGILDQDEIDVMKDLFFTDLETISPDFKRNDPRTHITDNLPGIGSVGIFKDPRAHFAFGRAMTRAREHMIPLYSALYGEDVIVSYDTGTFFPNHSYKLRNKRTPGNPKPKNPMKTTSGWEHVDQSPKNNTPCVQGVLLLTDATDGTGGFSCIPGSHLKYDDIIAAVGACETKSNFIKTPHDLVGDIVGKPCLINSPAGSAVFWNSKVIHANSPGTVKPDPNAKVLRMGCYVCAIPKRLDDPYSEIFRATALREKRLTNHWPIRPYAKFERLGRPRHRSLKPIGSCLKDARDDTDAKTV